MTGPHRTEQAADGEDRAPSSEPDGAESATADGAGDTDGGSGTGSTGATNVDDATVGGGATPGTVPGATTSTDTATDASTEAATERVAPADATTEPATAGEPATDREDATATSTVASTAPTTPDPTSPDDEDELANAEDRAYRRELRKGLLIGLGGGLLVGLVVALLLGAFVWPGYLLGPGDPQKTADRATSALAAKDTAGLDAVSCRSPEGQATAALPPQALQLIAKATSAGPVQRTLDTEARAPVDLTLNAQGQTQTLPSDLVLGVDGGKWCLNGLAERSQ